MMERYLKQENNSKKWIWILLLVSALAVMMFWVYKKSKKKKKRTDTDSYDYLAMGEECVACSGNENQDTHSGMKEL